MEPIDVAKQILSGSLEYRVQFQLRFDEYSEEQKQRTVKALGDCAGTLSRKFGRAPTDYIFGSDEFTRAELGELLTNLRKLFDYAESKSFDEGVTAVCVLQAMAGVMFARKLTDDASISMSADLKWSAIINLLRPIFEQYGPPDDRGEKVTQHFQTGAQ
jgi:hypothetical protein